MDEVGGRGSGRWGEKEKGNRDEVVFSGNRILGFNVSIIRANDMGAFIDNISRFAPFSFML